MYGLKTPQIFHCYWVIFHTFSECLRIIVRSGCVYQYDWIVFAFTHNNGAALLVYYACTVYTHFSKESKTLTAIKYFLFFKQSWIFKTFIDAAAAANATAAHKKSAL